MGQQHAMFSMPLLCPHGSAPARKKKGHEGETEKVKHPVGTARETLFSPTWLLWARTRRQLGWYVVPVSTQATNVKVINHIARRLVNKNCWPIFLICRSSMGLTRICNSKIPGKSYAAGQGLPCHWCKASLVRRPGNLGFGPEQMPGRRGKLLNVSLFMCSLFNISLSDCF